MRIQGKSQYLFEDLNQFHILFVFPAPTMKTTPNSLKYKNSLVYNKWTQEELKDAIKDYLANNKNFKTTY